MRRTGIRFAATIAAVVVVATLAACSSTPEPPPKPTAAPSAGTDHDIADAYIYLLGRLLVLRQEQIDLSRGGFKWNELVLRDGGAATAPDPNLDGVVGEAWVAVDDRTCAVLSMPRPKGRYFTVQVVNGWGETVANIDERVRAEHPRGRFGLCLKGAPVKLPPDVWRIDLPGRTARLQAFVESGKNRAQAVALRQQIELRMTGTPTIAPIPATPTFTFAAPPGVEAFDSAGAAFDSEPDSRPGTAPMQAKVRKIAAIVAADQAERKRVDQVIRGQVQPALKASLASAVPPRNGWRRFPAICNCQPETDFATRTRTNLVSPWMNDADQVSIFRVAVDGAGVSLDGNVVYTLTFAKDDLPGSHARYGWSVTAMDTSELRAIPNPKNRFSLGRNAPLQYGKDGSLTLYFASTRPAEAPDTNWLPTPKGQPYLLTLRAYGPDGAIAGGHWYPPPLIRK